MTATKRSDLIAGATRFKLIYDGHIEYCARCIVEKHKSKDCPKIACHCYGINGHMQFKCPTQMIQSNRSQTTNKPKNNADRRQTHMQKRSRPYPDRKGSWRGTRQGRGGRQPKVSTQQQPKASIQYEVRVTTRIDPRVDPRYAAFRHS